MALELDDIQVARHTFGNLADYVAVLEQELTRVGAPADLRHDLIVAWWQSTIAAANAPDFGSIMGNLLKRGEDS